jgi:hypothetical protein
LRGVASILAPGHARRDGWGGVRRARVSGYASDDGDRNMRPVERDRFTGCDDGDGNAGPGWAGDTREGWLRNNRESWDGNTGSSSGPGNRSGLSRSGRTGDQEGRRGDFACQGGRRHGRGLGNKRPVGFPPFWIPGADGVGDVRSQERRGIRGQG